MFSLGCLFAQLTNLLLNSNSLFQINLTEPDPSKLETVLVSWSMFKGLLTLVLSSELALDARRQKFWDSELMIDKLLIGCYIFYVGVIVYCGWEKV